MENTKTIISTNLKKVIKHLRLCLQKKDPQLIFKNDVRGSLFAVEGVLRLFLKSKSKGVSKKDKKTIEKSFVKIKKLEDQIGQFSLSYEMKEFSEKKNFADSIKNRVEKNILKENEKFLKKIKKDAVVESIEEVFSNLETVVWPKKESDFVINSLKKEIKNTEDKISSLKSIILSSNYSYVVLEDGFHEWRRKIRWVSIYMQAYKYLFGLEFKRKKDKKKYSSLIKEYKNDPFCQLSSKNYKTAVDTIKFYQLSDYIKRIGVIKSNGEMPYVFKKSLNLNIKKELIETSAHAIYNQFLKDKVLKKIILE